MPIDYSKYPPNWLNEIRPRIMKRANNTCEAEGCDFKHLEYVWSIKYKGEPTEWFTHMSDAQNHRCECVIPKNVKVILTIAHLDHDEENQNVQDDRLKAMCQICHLRYDAPEKARRRKEKQNQNKLEF